MASKELSNIVKKLGLFITESRNSFQPSERNEEWTKSALILPLLDGLGWDKGTDIGYESSPDNIEGRLDLIIKCKPPIGIETKALDVPAPRDVDHPQIKKGLGQCKERGASYFIWTNGDYWQFFSLALVNAPIYQITLSSIGDEGERVDPIAHKLRIIEKERFTANSKMFDEAICGNWKMTALPTAWEMLLKNHTSELLKLFRGGLPGLLDIKNEEILEFVNNLKAHEDVGRSRTQRDIATKHKFPEDWEQLLTSFEGDYERARRRFHGDYYSKFANYLLGEKYRPWSKSTTWRYVGLSDDPNERKKLGPVIALFREWHFIEDAEGFGMYKRVEDSVPFLKNLLEKE